MGGNRIPNKNWQNLKRRQTPNMEHMRMRSKLRPVFKKKMLRQKRKSKPLSSKLKPNKNMSQYTDRQAATMEKTRLEGVLVDTGNMLVQMQQSREDATAEKKELEAENMVIKKDIEDLELAIQ